MGSGEPGGSLGGKKGVRGGNMVSPRASEPEASDAHALMVAIASVVCGVVGVAALGTLMGVDAAGVPHGRTADVVLVLAWLTGGALALILGLPTRGTVVGRLGLVLAIVALPVGLVALGVLAAVLA